MAVRKKAAAKPLRSRAVIKTARLTASVPYYHQSTDFTCGPASLMMAMKALAPKTVINRTLELQLWREATTIFMGDGHGGCSALGLALAASRRGFSAEVWINRGGVFLADRQDSQDHIAAMRLLQQADLAAAKRQRIPVHRGATTVDDLRGAIHEGAIPIVLVSTNLFHGDDVPHWLVVTSVTDETVQVNDPWISRDQGQTTRQQAGRAVSHKQFNNMAVYGPKKERATVLIGMVKAQQWKEPIVAEESFDVVVIGGGPGGYVCAIKAAQLGLKTACIEKRGSLGGTCLNVGCIPSKALLTSSHKYAEASHSFAEHGIKIGKLELDLKAMMDRKTKVVGDLTKGIEFLFKKNKVTYLKGAGQLLGGGKVAVDGEAKQTVSAKHIIIATGSDVTPLPGVAIDEKQIVSSTGALALEKVPEHLIVIGGGVIGLEMGSVWLRLGAKVTVVEFLDRIVPTMDTEIGTQYQRILTKQGMAFKLGTKVTAAKSAKGKVTLTLEPAKGGTTEELAADSVLVAIGRKPYTTGLGLEKAGVALDDKGRIKTDHHFQTNVPGVYAIGDVIAGPMLAHKAEEEGVALAEMLAGQAGHVNYDTVPNVVYTWPELASVGKTEDELKAAGIAYKVGKFPYLANSRGKSTGDTEGLVKLIADAKTDRLLGAHILGPDAGTQIHECVMAMEFVGSAEDVARAFHAHPTFNEAIKEAAMAVGGKPIHM